MAKTISYILIALAVISIVFAAQYEYLYNPYIAKPDRTRSTNQSGQNWTFNDIDIEGTATGISLDEIEDLTTDKTFTMGGNTLEWLFTNPVGGMLWSFDGGAQGHLIEFTETVAHANGGHLLHVNATSPNMVAGHFHHEIDDETALLVDNGIINFTNADNFYVKNLKVLDAPVECPSNYYMTRWNGSESVCVLDDDSLYLKNGTDANLSDIRAEYLDITDKSQTDLREADISELNVADSFWYWDEADVNCYDSWSVFAETKYIGVMRDMVGSDVFLDGTEYYVKFLDGDEAGNIYALRDRLYSDEDNGGIDCDVIGILSPDGEPSISQNDDFEIYETGGTIKPYQDYVNISQLYTSTIDGVNSLAVQDDIAIGGATSGAPLAIKGTEVLDLGLVTMTYEPREYYSNHAGIYGEFANVVKDFSSDFEFLAMFYATGTGIAYQSANPIHEHGFLFNHLPPNSEDANITLVGFGGIRDIPKEIRFANSSGTEMFVLDAQPTKTIYNSTGHEFIGNLNVDGDITANSINLTQNITFNNGGKVGGYNSTCMAIWSPSGTAHTFCD